MAVIEIVDPASAPLTHGELPGEGWVGISRRHDHHVVIVYLLDYPRPGIYQGRPPTGSDGDKNFIVTLEVPCVTPEESLRYWRGPLGAQQLERSLPGFEDSMYWVLETVTPLAFATEQEFTLLAIRFGSVEDFWRLILTRMGRVAEATSDWRFSPARAIETFAESWLGPNWGTNEKDLKQGRLDALLTPMRTNITHLLEGVTKSRRMDEAIAEWLRRITFHNENRRALMRLLDEC